MKWLRSYIQTLWLSLSTASFYRDILRLKFRSAFAFFAVTMGLLAVFSIVWFRLVIFPGSYKWLREETLTALSTLPDSFSAQYQDGTLSFYGVGLPFHFPVGESLFDDFPKHWLTLGDSERAESLISLGPKELWVFTPNSMDSNQDHSIPYTDFWQVSGTMTKTQLEERITGGLDRFPKFASILSVIAFPFLWIYKMISVGAWTLLFALVFQTLAWMLGIRLTYVKSLQTNLHIAAVASLIALIGAVIAPNAGFSLFTGSCIAIICVVLWEIREKRVE